MANSPSISFRLSNRLNEEIIKEATEKGTTKTDIIVECIERRVSSVTPAKLVKLQNIVNDCCAEMEKTNPEKSAVLRKEMKDLWQ